jgi:Flp pilus assembly protein TadG
VNHKSQKGSATLLFALSLPVFICALVMAWDIGRLYTAKITARHSVILAARAAAAELDLELEELSNPGDLEPVYQGENEALNVQRIS